MKKLFSVLLVVGLMIFTAGSALAQTATASVNDLSATSVVVFPEQPTVTESYGHGYRAFGNPQNLVTPGFMPNVDTGNGPGAMYLSLEAAFKLKDTYTAEEANNMTDRWTGTQITLNLFKVGGSVSAVKFAAASKDGLKIPTDVELSGFVYANATKPNVPSTELLSDLTKKLAANGIVYAVLLSEGYDKEMVGNGWVVSAGYTLFGMSGTEKNMSVGGIGVGYGEGRSGMKTLPFAKFATFVAKPAPAPKKAEVTPAAPVKTTEGAKIEKVEPKPIQPASSEVPWYKRSTLLGN